MRGRESKSGDVTHDMGRMKCHLRQTEHTITALPHTGKIIIAMMKERSNRNGDQFE